MNLFAAGAICLDPDPTTLRGMVTLGTHLRYWSYSSSAADQYSSRKRRLRRGERGSNSNGERFSTSGRGALQDYIINETVELEREQKDRRKEMNHLAARFGVGLLGHGASEEETLAYARMLSEETFAQDEERRKSESDNSSVCGSSDTIISEGSVVLGGLSSPVVGPQSMEGGEEDDLAKAIRLSLLEAERAKNSGGCRVIGEVPVDQVDQQHPIVQSPVASSLSTANPSDGDLDLALQLNLAEQRSGDEILPDDEEAFPSLRQASSPSPGRKGKGKRRAS
jgi:hypothetical protein